MQYKETIKKMLVGLLLILAAAAALTLIARQFMGPDTNVAEQEDGQLKLNKQDVAAEQLPQQFPSNLPVEAGATITENFNATTDDGRIQATRAFTTKKTLAENLTLYTKYMKDNGWTIGLTVDESMEKMVAGSKGSQRLQVNIVEHPSTNIRTVTISVTEI